MEEVEARGEKKAFPDRESRSKSRGGIFSWQGIEN